MDQQSEAYKCQTQKALAEEADAEEADVSYKI